MTEAVILITSPDAWRMQRSIASNCNTHKHTYIHTHTQNTSTNTFLHSDVGVYFDFVGILKQGLRLRIIETVIAVADISESEMKGQLLFFFFLHVCYSLRIFLPNADCVTISSCFNAFYFAFIPAFPDSIRLLFLA